MKNSLTLHVRKLPLMKITTYAVSHYALFYSLKYVTYTRIVIDAWSMLVRTFTRTSPQSLTFAFYSRKLRN